MDTAYSFVIPGAAPGFEGKGIVMIQSHPRLSVLLLLLLLVALVALAAIGADVDVDGWTW